MTHQQYPLCLYVNSIGFSKSLPWDSDEGRGAALREYDFLI